MVAASPSLEETRTSLAAEWARWSPSTPEEIAAFYRDSERLGDDLEAWHRTAERQEWTQAIVEIAKNNGVKSVLDVGAGAGHDLLAVKRALGLPDWGSAVWAVEPNRELGNRIPNVTVSTGIEFVEPTAFDLVLCIDVLEHVPDPEALLTDIMARVKMGGLLIEATATHDQSTPLHLPELEGWMPDEILKANGFRAVDTVNRLAVWQKAEIQVAPATVIVVAHREISVPTVECLFDLVGRHGWPLTLPYGDALIDRGRSKAASSWYLNSEEDVFLMIDDDIVFRTEDAVRVVALAREKKSIACAAYPVADGGHLASRAWPGTLLEFGDAYEAREIRWPATGFMAVHRDVITALVNSMEPCYPDQPDKFWPMFTPFKLGPDYLSEDYAFGQRAMDLGFKTWLDPKSILIHLKIKGLSVYNMPGATVRHRDELPDM